MSEDFYRDACDALMGFLPSEFSGFEHRLHGRGLKVWFGDAHREHYELQEVGMINRDGRELLERALEIGFHTEHPDPALNEQVLARFGAGEKAWRRALGAEAQIGRFVNDQRRGWQRVSEFWTGPEIDEPDTAIDAADRLARYIAALEPLRTATPPASPSPARSARSARGTRPRSGAVRA